MTPAEVLARSRDTLVKVRWRRRQVSDMARDSLTIPPRADQLPTPLPPVDPDSVSAKARHALLRAADELLSGRWPIFDRTRNDMADTPDWFLDPRTGRRAPHERYAFDINIRQVEQVGTVKYVWEISRHQHLSMLAAAYWLTGNEAYAEFIARHLRSWWSENAFLSGVHWTSGIELGVRLISWVWIRRLLDGWSGCAALFEENVTFLKQLHHHQDYLAELPSSGSSANNHLIAEMAGQFVACCAFPHFPESAHWQRDAAARLKQEITAQTFPCGLNRELATGYHGFVLELALAAGLEGEAAGHSLGAKYWLTLRNMCDALAAIVDVNLKPPRQGDDDEGQGLLVDAPEFDRWASLLATGQSLFGACEWWPRLPCTDLRSLIWTQLAQSPPLPTKRPDRRPAHFPEAGMTILRHRAGQAEEIWCRCDHGLHGYLSIAAHAHADALSIEVRHGGTEILTDPGTYMYQGEVEWRSYFRSTLGHNCLEVDGTDQSVIGGPFMWLRTANSSLIELRGEEESPSTQCHARHDGYGRLSPAAIHDRRVVLDREAESLLITDTLKSDGEHACRLAFHLGPEVECNLEGRRAQLRWDSDAGSNEALLILPEALMWTAVRAQEDPPLGWYSPSFGVKVSATCLLGVGRLRGGTSLKSELRIKGNNGSLLMEESCAVTA
jgi:hypothetical protein